MQIAQTPYPPQKTKRPVQHYLVRIYQLLVKDVKKLKLFLSKRTIRLMRECDAQLANKQNKQSSQIDQDGEQNQLVPAQVKKLRKLQHRQENLTSRLSHFKALSSRPLKFIIFHIMLNLFKIDLSPLINPSKNASDCINNTKGLYKKISADLQNLIDAVKSGQYDTCGLTEEFVQFITDAYCKHKLYIESKSQIEDILEKRANKMLRTKNIKSKKKERILFKKQNKLPETEQLEQQSEVVEITEDQPAAPITKKIKKISPKFLQRQKFQQENNNSSERTEFKKVGRNKLKIRDQDKNNESYKSRIPIAQQPQSIVQDMHPSWQAKLQQKQMEKAAMTQFQGTKKNCCEFAVASNLQCFLFVVYVREKFTLLINKAPPL